MIFATLDNTIDWNCNSTWRQSAYNTMWCLIGCSIGDMGTIYYIQVNEIPWSTLSIMLLAMTNGIITSIILETIKSGTSALSGNDGPMLSCIQLGAAIILQRASGNDLANCSKEVLQVLKSGAALKRMKK